MVLQITQGHISDSTEIFRIYLNAKEDLEKNGLFQWTDKYPKLRIIEDDLKAGELYILKQNNDIIGAISINEKQEAEYATVNWQFNASKVLVIHRLVIALKHQRKGYARKLMDYAEEFAQQNAYTSIRLDAYSVNKRVNEFYKNRNYIIRGEVFFPGREYAFHCMEKDIDNINKHDFGE